MDEKEVLMTWLGGRPVELHGVVYIYPHGQTAIRKMLKANTNFEGSQTALLCYYDPTMN